MDEFAGLLRTAADSTSSVEPSPYSFSGIAPLRTIIPAESLLLLAR